MSNQAIWQLHIQHHKHDWPVNGVEAKNVLSNHVVNSSIPELIIVGCLFLTVSQSSRIVKQSIYPYVNNVFWIRRNRYSPCKGCTGYRQIFQAWLDEVFHDFIHSTIRLDKVWVSIEEFNQFILIFAEAEEVRFF